ncbi:FtsW/RodA/SpoVE family cell cycle protein [Pedobacter steynii]
MINQQSNRFFFNVDWITILIYIALCTVGYVNIYASVPSHNTADSSVFNFTSNYGKQLIYIIAGLVLGFSILLLDAKFFSVFSPIVYGVTVLLLIIVLLVGRNVGGNQAWISLGGVLGSSLLNLQNLAPLYYSQGTLAVLALNSEI